MTTNATEQVLLTHLDRQQLITAAEYVLTNEIPPKHEADYFSSWVKEKHLGRDVFPSGFAALSADLSEDELKRLPTDPELQRQVLEPAIREVLDCIRTMPDYYSMSLSSAVLQAYRRELIWLVGRWIEAGGQA